MEKLFCSRCKQDYVVVPSRWRCDCGSFLDLEFKATFPIGKIRRRRPTLWRYREAIPIYEEDHIISMGEGCTPLEPMEIDHHRVLIKIDYLFPTGSYKDRGAAVLVSKAKELGIRKVVEDSSGNAGAAIAAYCAKAGIGCEIYVPRGTSPGKLVQIRAHGAHLIEVEGARERTAKAAREAASTQFYASHYWNPYFLHGTKTFAFEVWEQLGWSVPDLLVLPVGHGTLFLGTYLGFRELRDAGMIKKIPRLVGVQSAACAPLHLAYQRGSAEALPIQRRETIAEGIAIANPVRGSQILEAVRETGGVMVRVTEKEIQGAFKEVAQKGYFIEPTSAATIAGLKKYLKGIREEVVVSTLTGIGLKATEKLIHSTT